MNDALNMGLGATLRSKDGIHKVITILLNFNKGIMSKDGRPLHWNNHNKRSNQMDITDIIPKK